jgi:hypothetical protein
LGCFVKQGDVLCVDLGMVGAMYVRKAVEAKGLGGGGGNVGLIKPLEGLGPIRKELGEYVGI